MEGPGGWGTIGAVPTNSELRVNATYGPAADCWLHEALEVHPSPIEGQGLFAAQSFVAGAVVARLGGWLVSDGDLERLIPDASRGPRRRYVDSIAVAGGTNLVIPPGQAIHFTNHSCAPSLWHIGPFTIATRREIAAGEEVTIDYATQTTNPQVRIDCRCGSSACRATVTGEDWKLGELRERYGEHWVPAVLDKIAPRPPAQHRLGRTPASRQSSSVPSKN
jgi:hypothetical protein